MMVLYKCSRYCNGPQLNFKNNKIYHCYFSPVGIVGTNIRLTPSVFPNKLNTGSLFCLHNCEEWREYMYISCYNINTFPPQWHSFHLNCSITETPTTPVKRVSESAPKDKWTNFNDCHTLILAVVSFLFFLFSM